MFEYYRTGLWAMYFWVTGFADVGKRPNADCTIGLLSVDLLSPCESACSPPKLAQVLNTFGLDLTNEGNEGGCR